MQRGWSGSWNRYIIAAICAILGLMLRVPVSAVLGTDVPYITFFPAIVFSTWYEDSWVSSQRCFPAYLRTASSMVHFLRSQFMGPCHSVSGNGWNDGLGARATSGRPDASRSPGRQEPRTFSKLYRTASSRGREMAYGYVTRPPRRCIARDRDTLLGTPILTPPGLCQNEIEHAFRGAARTREPVTLEVERSGAGST